MQSKKYDLSNEYIVVIGGANIDIGGTTYKELVPADSNPGSIITGCGGVGRNIAHNLANLGINVKLITAIGDDYGGRFIKEQCESAGIDMTYSVTVPGARSSMYIYINDHNGDMAVALSHMDIVQNITPEYIDSVADVIRKSAAVVIDGNVLQDTFLHVKKICRDETIDRKLISTTDDWKSIPTTIGQRCNPSSDFVEAGDTGAYSKDIKFNENFVVSGENSKNNYNNLNIPIYLDPVSTAHAHKIKGHLEGIEVIKPNRLEAEFLTGMTIETEGDYRAAAYELIRQGVNRVFISMGEGGVVAADKNDCHIVEGFPTEVANTTGAGDAATAAIVWASLCSDGSLIFTAKAANAAASIAVASAHTINSELSPEKITDMISI